MSFLYSSHTLQVSSHKLPQQRRSPKKYQEKGIILSVAIIITLFVPKRKGKERALQICKIITCLFIASFSCGKTKQLHCSGEFPAIRPWRIGDFPNICYYLFPNAGDGGHWVMANFSCVYISHDLWECIAHSLFSLKCMPSTGMVSGQDYLLSFGAF